MPRPTHPPLIDLMRVHLHAIRTAFDRLAPPPDSDLPIETLGELLPFIAELESLIADLRSLIPTSRATDTPGDLRSALLTAIRHLRAMGSARLGQHDARDLAALLGTILAVIEPDQSLSTPEK